MSDERHRDRTQTIQIPMDGTCEACPPNLQAILTVIRGGGADLGKTFRIEEQAWIGRSPSACLRLNDPGVSWKHALIAFEEGTYTIDDSGSTNGTRIGGKKIRGKIELRDGDKIFMGKTVVRFSLADELDAGFQKEVAQLVGTDPLTGLESKRCFDDALDQTLASAQATRANVAVLMMDMDNIKEINDNLGHLFGAFCIQQAGRIIGKVIGASGHVCRFGGDEFTAFLLGADKTLGMEVAEEIRAKIEQAQLTMDGIELRPTISIGVAVYPDDAKEVLDLVARADSALYRAKAKGKNAISN